MDLVGRMTPRTQTAVVQNELKHEKQFHRSNFNRGRIEMSYDGEEIVHTINDKSSKKQSNFYIKPKTDI